MSPESKSDFYVDRRGLACYFEKEWMDHVLKSNPQIQFAFPEFDPLFLYGDFNEKLVSFIKTKLMENKLSPTSMVEVGSAVGRTYYEVCKHIPSVVDATLIEPSQNLAGTFEKIFKSDADEKYPTLLGNKEISEVTFNTSDIKNVVSSKKLKLIVEPFQKITESIPPADLVICSNVIDQCDKPLSLIDFLMPLVKPNGLLVLSCTYQWNEKYVGQIDYPNYPIQNINDLFGKMWNRLGETNLEFRCRKNERYWATFMSHVSIFQKC